MKDEVFNGWKNYETWLCVVWYYDYFYDVANVSMPDAYPLSDLEDMLRNIINDEFYNNQNIPAIGLFHDLLYNCINKIDFRTIAEHIAEDIN